MLHFCGMLSAELDVQRLLDTMMAALGAAMTMGDGWAPSPRLKA